MSENPSETEEESLLNFFAILVWLRRRLDYKD